MFRLGIRTDKENLVADNNNDDDDIHHVYVVFIISLSLTAYPFIGEARRRNLSSLHTKRSLT
jgi:hypothetical protein